MMSISAKQLDDKLRNVYLAQVKKYFEDVGEEVLITGTNEICIPCLDEQSNEKFIQIVVKVPKGSRDGESFDGYSLAEEFKIKQELKENKKREDEEKKKKKIEKDKKLREERKNLKEKKGNI